MAGRGRGANVVIQQAAPFNPVNEALKAIHPEKFTPEMTLFSWLKKITQFFHTKGLFRFCQLDLDVNALAQGQEVIIGAMDWGALSQEDQSGDKVVRHLLLTNLPDDISGTLLHLQHGSEVYRALQQVRAAVCFMCNVELYHTLMPNYFCGVWGSIHYVCDRAPRRRPVIGVRAGPQVLWLWCTDVPGFNSTILYILAIT